MRAFHSGASSMLAFAALASGPVLAQMPVAPIDLPKVIFCAGQCFAVDDRGIRTPVAKGAVLREGQRLETGPGTYAQLKLGPAAEIALSERGQVRFDQRSVNGRDLVILDQGRLRMIGGEAVGKIATRLLELRTSDGTFSLKGADIEVKKIGAGIGGANPTLMKVNAGNASLGTIPVPKDAVQGYTGGKPITDKSFSPGEIALTVRNPIANARAPIAPAPVATLPPQAGLPTADSRAPGSTLVPMPPIQLAPPITTVVKPTDVYVAPLTTTLTSTSLLSTSTTSSTSTLSTTSLTLSSSTTTTTSTTSTTSSTSLLSSGSTTLSTSTTLCCSTTLKLTTF